MEAAAGLRWSTPPKRIAPEERGRSGGGRGLAAESAHTTTVGTTSPKMTITGRDFLPPYHPGGCRACGRDNAPISERRRSPTRSFLRYAAL